MGWLIVERLKLFEEREKRVQCKTTRDYMLACFEKNWWSGFDGREKRRALGFASLYCTIWNCCLAKLPNCCCLTNFFPLRYLKLPTLFLICLLLKVKLRPPNICFTEMICCFFWNQFCVSFCLKIYLKVEWTKSQKQSRNLERQIGGNRCTSWQLLHQNKNGDLTVMECRNRYLTGTQRQSN